jgi:hypothetical protein
MEGRTGGWVETIGENSLEFNTECERKKEPK